MAVFTKRQHLIFLSNFMVSHVFISTSHNDENVRCYFLDKQLNTLLCGSFCLKLTTLKYILYFKICLLDSFAKSKQRRQRLEVLFFQFPL